MGGCVRWGKTVPTHKEWPPALPQTVALSLGVWLWGWHRSREHLQLLAGPTDTKASTVQNKPEPLTIVLRLSWDTESGPPAVSKSCRLHKRGSHLLIELWRRSYPLSSCEIRVQMEQGTGNTDWKTATFTSMVLKCTDMFRVVRHNWIVTLA